MKRHTINETMRSVKDRSSFDVSTFYKFSILNLFFMYAKWAGSFGAPGVFIIIHCANASTLQ